MAIQNRIVKVQKRNRALVRFDVDRIGKAILRAARSVGGFSQDFMPNVNDKIFEAHGTEEQIAAFLADAVVVCLNANAHYLIANFPPTIESIQDGVLHALRSYGFQSTADAYECYRWGRHWLREGALTPPTFMGNGFPQERMTVTLDWCQQHHVHTVDGLNEAVRSGKIKTITAEALALYEKSLDEAAGKVLTRLRNGDRLRMIWISGPSSSGKTTTTVKLTQRLEQHGLCFLMLNRHLQALLAGQTIEKPVYSFKEGRRTGTKRVKLEADQMLLLDCLHGFYPPINEGIDVRAQFRLYIETQNTLFEGDGQTQRLTKFTDVRLLRRMLRDARHRNHSALRTMLHWHYVRAGELFSIIPLQGLADHVVNGGFPFDLPALKPLFCRPGEFASVRRRLPGIRRSPRRENPLSPREDAARFRERLHDGTGDRPRPHPGRRHHPRIHRRQHHPDSAQRIGAAKLFLMGSTTLQTLCEPPVAGHKQLSIGGSPYDGS